MHRLVVWLALLLGHVAALAQIPDLIGEWGPVLNWGYQGKHMALLPTDKVLVFRTGDSARVWDPVANEFTQTPFLFGDLHCAAQVSLADGRVLVIPEIDAPEKGQPYGSPAKQALSDLVFGKVATVREQTRDRYGRTVGRVYVDGRDMNRSPRKPFATGATTSGIWLSTAEIMALPMSGAAWNNVLTRANSSWGSADLSNLDAQHDVLTLAGALVAVRANDTSMRNKTITGLQSAMVSPLSGTLGLARGLQSYVIAADIIGYRTPAFEAWVSRMLVEPIPGRLGNGLYSNALKDSTNWGGHERASSIAAVIYLDDTARLNELVRAHREYLGENVSPKTMDYEPTNWHADPNNKAGVNRIGSIIQGKNVSGVMPEDWRRNSEFQWPPDPGVYQWEGVQGYVVASAILQRRSLVPFNSADNAVVRVMNMLYGNGEAATNSPVFTNPPVGDDTWIPWLVNSFAGSAYPTTIPTQAGKGMGYTDWTHP